VSVYPSLQEVLQTHDRLIDLFGGAAGVRERGALEAALARPKSGYYKDTLEEAAALLESLFQNHRFVDGNKRTAFTVTAAFLQVNGYGLEFEDLEESRFLLDLSARGEFRFDRLVS
jgi:death on curing protein